MRRTYIPKKIRQQVKDRAKNCCEYCKALGSFSFHPFPIDHILAVALGGTNDLDNLANTCQHCNGCKYNKFECIDPLTGKTFPVFHPRQQNWSEHFTWDSNQINILGTSPTGRATVACLKMNRLEAVNLREALIEFGVHPPE